MKCHYCKQEILPEQLHREPKKDKNGNIKTSKTGKVQYQNSHIQCFERVKKDKKEFDALYDYILDKYFIKTVPTSLIKSLRELRKYYDFGDMLECLESIEDNLRYNIDKIEFNNGYQKGNYIMAALSNNIDTWYEKKSKKVIEENKQIKNIKINNYFVSQVDVELETDEDESDYDFLD